MSDFVYKQMINKVTNLPIQGGVFFLRDVEGIRDDIPLVELPDDGTGSTQGRYVSETEVHNGVYSVYRSMSGVDTPTGDEVHVESGRVTHASVDDEPLTPITSRLLAGVVYALAFLPDGQADDQNVPASYLNEALAYAAANDAHKVVVGSYKGRDTWSGSVTLTIPEGVKEIDLDGATVSCLTANLPVFEATGSSPLAIENGTLQAAGAGATAHVVSSAPILYSNVTFIGNSATSGFTTQTPTSAPTEWVGYIGCNGVKIDSGRKYRDVSIGGGGAVGSCKQFAIGGGTVIDPIFAPNLPTAMEVKSIVYSDVDPSGLDALVWEPLRALSGAPSYTTGGPFVNVTDAMKAIKYLWFVDKPKAETVYANGEVCDTTFYKIIGASTMVVRRFDATNSSGIGYDDSYSSVDQSIVNGSVPVGVDIDPGVIVRKYRSINSTIYNRIEIEAICHFRSFAAYWGNSRYHQGWAPLTFTINAAVVSGAFREFNSQSNMTVSLVNSAEIEAFGVNSGGRYFSKKFSGNAFKNNDTVVIDGEAINQQDTLETPLSGMMPFVDSTASGPVFIRAKAILENPARTTFPRFK